nr:insulinase family protein [Bacteroidota bacterium]
RIYSQYEKSYNDRDKTESRRRTNELIDHFLDGESAPGIEWEFSRLPVILESFSLAEINDLVPVMYPDHSIVVQISMPDGKGITIPTEDQIDDLFKKVDQYAVSAYVDDASDKPLLENLPQPGKIMNQTLLNDLGVHEWELSNGVKVVAKPTGFKNDEVLFHSYAHGGNSLTSDADYRSGRLASSIVEESGAGGFNTIQLEKLLTGKLVTVSPYIDKYFHGMNGSSTPKDLETAFQLLYVMWTDPNYDQETFSNLMERYKVMVANRENNPESKWNDLVNDVNYGSHYSVQPWTPEALDDVNLDAAMKIYKERFSNPANFTFLFVGNFDLSELKKLTEVYLGGLPVLNHEKTHPVEYNYKFPYLPKHAKIYMGSEEKSRTRITFSRPLDADFDTYYYLDAATDLLEVRLRKILREDMGATYHVGSGTMNMQPSSDFAQTHIAFNCAPENVKKMTKAVMKEIKNLKKKAPTAEEVHNINEKYLNQREINLESNRYWVNALEGCYQHSIDPQDILERDDRIRSFTPEIARKMIKKYYPKFKYTTVTLYPAK